MIKPHFSKFILSSLIFATAGTTWADSSCPNPSITLDTENPAPVFTWTTQKCSPTDTVDVPAYAVVDQKNQVQMLLGVGGGDNHSSNYRMMGATLDQLTRDCQNGSVMQGRPHIFNPPKQYDRPDEYDNWKWILQPWYDVSTKTMYAFVHNEFDGYWNYPDNKYCSAEGKLGPTCWYPSILLAQSVDGKKYKLIKPHGGPIVGSPYRYVKDGGTANGSINQGIPIQTNILSSPMGDGYLYMFVDTSVGPAGTTRPVDGMCLLRSKNPNDPTDWVAYDPDTKQYTNDMTVNPYKQKLVPTDHVCNPILKGVFCTSWNFNTVLNRYVLICVAISPPQDNHQIPTPATFVYLLSNGSDPKDPTSWDPTTHTLMPIQWHTYPGQSFPSMLDPNGTTDGQGNGSGHNFEYSGASPYFYYVQYNPVLKGVSPWQNRDVLRVQAHVSCGDRRES